jgi:hypothetical protein
VPLPPANPVGGDSVWKSRSADREDREGRLLAGAKCRPIRLASQAKSLSGPTGRETLAQGIGLWPQPWALFSRPVGPVKSRGRDGPLHTSNPDLTDASALQGAGFALRSPVVALWNFVPALCSRELALPRGQSGEQRAESREQRAGSREERAGTREPRAHTDQQRAAPDFAWALRPSGGSVWGSRGPLRPRRGPEWPNRGLDGISKRERRTNLRPG